MEQNIPAPLRSAPGPRTWPWIGNVGIARGLLAFLEGEWARHGDVFRVALGRVPTIALASPDQIQRVLVSHRHNYVKGGTYDLPRRILGDGLITLDGKPWKERRSLAQPAFHRAALERLTAVMADSGARFCHALLEQLSEPQVLDVRPQMIRLTLDVVISALFGRGTLHDSRVSYRALGETLELLSESANGIPLPSWLPTPRNLKFQRTRRDLDSNVYEIIAASRERADHETLLAMLLASRDEEGQTLSDLELRDEVITLFIAGHETTALTLTWVFALLDQRVDVLSRMRDEVKRVLCGREPCFGDLPKLTYLRQVIDETLRLRPPVAMVARDAVADDELGGFRVESGQAVLPFFWAAHRHPDHWPDAERFDPERFAPSSSKGRHPASYLPFSIGPRTCIGNAFSLLETTILLAQLLQRFDFEVLSCADVRPVAVGTVRPSRPVRVRFARRRED